MRNRHGATAAYLSAPACAALVNTGIQGDGMIELSKVIRDLRSELEKAVVVATGEKLRFEMQDIELEMEVAIEASGKAGAKARFWVVDVEAESAVRRASTQRIKLSLKPALVIDGVEQSAYVSGRAGDNED
jgi:hypothetical protein